ncbi:uncharacterized protein PHACADRAFT_258363 [Phanerochaete carnosa HHB-10118-sp]|uniref:Uncharacterized protein n=1 Tax=Phanerochaete carnosa (strain HHB-10118-sp) TaxID=650164 RepID=K5UWQ5_PHACS|nr:uncharacterized protein PHACADRAFT_258363 [Phanerochaete carnosa HHB-10118-sp]EKM54486.1 hypothetical protein PHACADRAFT_258363 [Phanerochaete carnosa HHB-10118-sp]
MASAEEIILNAPHRPGEKAIEAFHVVLHTIKSEIIKSRHHWNKHEPKMWARAAGLTDEQLVHFTIESDLVEVRSAPTSYGTIILGKIRLPAVQDEEGAGYVHIRIHDPPNRGTEDVLFHSIWTDEGNRNVDGHPMTWRAIQIESTPLEFFNE